MYLYDETQAIAKSYTAACTPDIFLFDQNKKLVYRGQIDQSRPKSQILFDALIKQYPHLKGKYRQKPEIPGHDKDVSGEDLREALDRMLSGDSPVVIQKPSMGCNIKWKPDTAPNYFG